MVTFSIEILLIKLYVKSCTGIEVSPVGKLRRHLILRS
jgi:hypothetical protein